MNCSKCGKALVPGAKFCGTCGTTVPAQAAAPAAPAAHAPGDKNLALMQTMVGSSMDIQTELKAAVAQAKSVGTPAASAVTVGNDNTIPPPMGSPGPSAAPAPAPAPVVASGD